MLLKETGKRKLQASIFRYQHYHFPNPEEARMGRPRGIDFQIPKESLKLSEVKISKEFDKEARDLAGKIESFSQKADDQAHCHF